MKLCQVKVYIKADNNRYPLFLFKYWHILTKSDNDGMLLKDIQCIKS
jgi:hypothetical protein